MPEALAVLIEAMRAGDIQAAGTLISYCLGKPRPESAIHQVENFYPGLTVNEIAGQLVNDMASGAIPSTLADSAIGVLLKQQELTLKTDFMKELAELKAMINSLSTV